jgi:hypothetical protein
MIPFYSLTKEKYLFIDAKVFADHIGSPIFVLMLTLFIVMKYDKKLQYIKLPSNLHEGKCSFNIQLRLTQ